MSANMNGYERRIANRLQMQMSKREAEEAIYDIRLGMYGDEYTQIHPTYTKDVHGNISKEWPSMGSVLWAYHNNDYSKFYSDEEIEEESVEEELSEEEQEKNRIIQEAKKLAAQHGDVVQNTPHHFGTLKQHVDNVIDAVEKLQPDNLELMIAAIYHDTGKPETMVVNQKTGYSQFIGHAEKSAELFKADSEKLDLNDEQKKYISELIRLHDTKYSKQGKCITMLNEHPNGFAMDLLTLQFADMIGQSKENLIGKSQEIKKFAELLKKVGEPEQTEGLDYIIKMNIPKLPERDENTDKVWLARTASNDDVYISAETYEHMKAHPDVSIAHIVEAIGKINDYNGQFRIGPVNMERTVGKDNCIEVSPEERLMAFRNGRNGESSVVFNREPADTDLVTVGICKDDDGKATMFTAFYGQLAPKEPWDQSLSPEAREESEKFWRTHALVVTEDVIDWERTDPSIRPEAGEKFTNDLPLATEFFTTGKIKTPDNKDKDEPKIDRNETR